MFVKLWCGEILMMTNTFGRVSYPQLPRAHVVASALLCIGTGMVGIAHDVSTDMNNLDMNTLILDGIHRLGFRKNSIISH